MNRTALVTGMDTSVIARRICVSLLESSYEVAPLRKAGTRLARKAGRNSTPRAPSSLRWPLKQLTFALRASQH